MQKINFQDLPNTTTPINSTNLNAIQTNTENAINAVYEEGTWTPILENCTYTPYGSRAGKYIKIGKMVILTFHERPYISALTGSGLASISGLPYKPAWPQLCGGSLSTCMVTNTNYIPVVGVSPDDNGYIILSNNTDGSQLVQWKTTDRAGSYWLNGIAIYTCE